MLGLTSATGGGRSPVEGCRRGGGSVEEARRRSSVGGEERQRWGLWRSLIVPKVEEMGESGGGREGGGAVSRWQRTKAAGQEADGHGRRDGWLMGLHGVTVAAGGVRGKGSRAAAASGWEDLWRCNSERWGGPQIWWHNDGGTFGCRCPMEVATNGGGCRWRGRKRLLVDRVGSHRRWRGRPEWLRQQVEGQSDVAPTVNGDARMQRDLARFGEDGGWWRLL